VPKVEFSLPADLHAQAAERAKELGLTVNAYAKDCLRTALLDWVTRHHVYVKGPKDPDTTSIGRSQVETRFKSSMKEKP